MALAAPPVRSTATASAWAATGRRQLEPGERPDSDEVLWVHLGATMSPTDGQGLAAVCRDPGPTEDMLNELVAPDRAPQLVSYRNGRIKRVTTCALRFEREPRSLWVQSVELLASKDWLITSWHPARRFGRGGESGQTEGGRVVDVDERMESIERRWRDGGRETGGDLGILLMDELALSFAETERELAAALEEWELRLYGDERSTANRERERKKRKERNKRRDELAQHKQELHELWRLRALMREWIARLNVPGIGDDIGKTWLPCANHNRARALDDRIDRVLKDLAELGDDLRSGFHLLHIEQHELDRDEREARHRQIEIIAAILVIPTVILGLYGANTWVPGQDREWGFAAMLGVVLAATLVAIGLLAWTRDRDAVDDQSP